ncbi:hypothetical protein [Halosolutus halophilus]|uniref:hypothetical protein n=1 Tax=Halosolutus halophilus TaxID=1552990 RepID=UPI0022352C87|nr:hypothetical protein [Halosolutus halophilus]
MGASGDDDRAEHGRAEDDRPAVGDPDSPDRTDERSAIGPGESGPSPPRLSSRILVTWIELTVVGITGGLLGAAVGGPPGFVIYLATTLLTVGIVFHNVNELVKAWLRASSGRSIE